MRRLITVRKMVPLERTDITITGGSRTGCITNQRMRNMAHGTRITVGLKAEGSGVAGGSQTCAGALEVLSRVAIHRKLVGRATVDAQPRNPRRMRNNPPIRNTTFCRSPKFEK